MQDECRELRYLESFLVGAIVLTGIVFLGHFESKTPLWRRVSKWVM